MGIIYLILFIFFVIVVFSMMRIEPPKRLKKEREEWEQKKLSKEMSVTDIAKHFKKSANEVNQILLNLKWIEKKDNWYIATKAGEEKGANQKYNTRTKNKYVVWDGNIINNQEFIEEIKNLKIQNAQTISEEKKAKGDRYEKYVAEYFKNEGYYVWEHGKEKGVEDSGVDLFLKKDEYIYFVQCKDWEHWKLDHNTIQAIQTKIRNFLKKEEGLRKLTNGYKQKILYVTSKKCLTPGAYKYIEENSDILEYRIIPIEA